jgi:hypothetical protein
MTLAELTELLRTAESLTALAGPAVSRSSITSAYLRSLNRREPPNLPSGHLIESQRTLQNWTPLFMSTLFRTTVTSLHRRLRPGLLQVKITSIPTWGRIMASTTTQPPWTQPRPSYSPPDLNLEPPLKVFNSLTRSKDIFLPEKSDAVTW